MRRFVTALIVLLAAFAWLGTRYIWKFGSITSWPTEFGTLGVFATELLAFEIAVLTAVEAWRRRASLARREIFASLALLALACASAAWSPDPYYALLSGGRILLGIGLMIAMIVWRPSPRAVLGALVFGAAVNAGLGIWQFLSQAVGSSTWFGIAGHLPSDLGAFVVESDTGRWLRAYGGMAHPNILGLLAAVGLLAAAGLLQQAKNHKQRATLLGLVVILAAGLAVSVSRGAFLSLLAGLGAAGAALPASKTRAEAEPLLWSAAIVVAVMALFVGLFQEVFLTRIGASDRLERQSIDDRLRSYEDARTLIAANPIFGVGIGQMPAAVQAAEGARPAPVALDRLGLRYRARHPSQFQPAHNEALLVTAELGLLGLILWLLIRARILAALIRAGRHNKEEAALNAAILGIFVALLTAGLVDHFLWTSWFGQILFWLTAGLAVTVTFDPKGNSYKSGSR